jgi:DnaJ-class molecular chaperone
MGPSGGMQFGPGGGMQGGIPGFFGHFMKPQTIHVEVALELEQVYTGCVVPVHFERFVVRQENRRHSERRTLEVSIPAGVQDGEVIVLTEVGNTLGEMVGDVKIRIQIAPHAVFQRDGANLIHIKTLTLRESLCGFAFEIPLLNGRFLTIKNVVEPIRVIYPDMQQVCPGYGLSQGANDSTGALVIHFKIEFPDSLSEEIRTQLSTLLP